MLSHIAQHTAATPSNTSFFFLINTKAFNPCLKISFILVGNVKGYVNRAPYRLPSNRVLNKEMLNCLMLTTYTTLNTPFYFLLAKLSLVRTTPCLKFKGKS
jgi:hypothetical protein